MLPIAVELRQRPLALAEVGRRVPRAPTRARQRSRTNTCTSLHESDVGGSSLCCLGQHLYAEMEVVPMCSP